MKMPAIKKNNSRVIDIINWAEKYFSLKGFEYPRKEIEWLLEEILGCRRLDLYLRFEEELPSDQLKLLHTWITRRIKKEPLQYIIESCEFYGRKFFVNDNVFIQAEGASLVRKDTQIKITFKNIVRF